MVDTIMFNPNTDMLAAITDGQLAVWYYPSVVYVDVALLEATRFKKDAADAGKQSQFVAFSNSQIIVRRMNDGAHICMHVSPYPAMLYQQCSQGMWPAATRLCRFVKDNGLWACLAAMAVNNRQLDTAEIAYAAIQEVDRLQYIKHIREIPSEEGRNAAIALFRRQPEEAVAILLQAGLLYRAINDRFAELVGVSNPDG